MIEKLKHTRVRMYVKVEHVGQSGFTNGNKPIISAEIFVHLCGLLKSLPTAAAAAAAAVSNESRAAVEKTCKFLISKTHLN